mmetsp:Transcript_107247/g.272195  ORF Transcript_107247/g.272195 Transcript_107247/m.272195 type:complete len:231 (+) Transcript_107247:167-859(+)
MVPAVRVSYAMGCRGGGPWPLLVSSPGSLPSTRAPPVGLRDCRPRRARAPAAGCAGRQDPGRGRGRRDPRRGLGSAPSACSPCPALGPPPRTTAAQPRPLQTATQTSSGCPSRCWLVWPRTLPMLPRSLLFLPGGQRCTSRPRAGATSPALAPAMSLPALAPAPAPSPARGWARPGGAALAEAWEGSLRHCRSFRGQAPCWWLEGALAEGLLSLRHEAPMSIHSAPPLAA